MIDPRKKADRESSSEVCQMMGCSNKNLFADAFGPNVTGYASRKVPFAHWHKLERFLPFSNSLNADYIYTYFTKALHYV